MSDPRPVATPDPTPAPTGDGTSGEPRFRAPDTYVIIFFVILFAAVLTYMVPAGSFDTTTVRFADAAGAVQEREVLVAEGGR